jgi:hypothetical protein
MTLQFLIGLVLMTSFGCAGIKMATPLSVASLRQGPQVADVGFTSAQGVPSLAERFAARPGLKVAVAQVAYAVEGRPTQVFKDNYRSNKFVETWTEVTVPDVLVPPEFAMAAAVDATQRLEQALTQQGFSVIPYQKVAETQAYQNHYGSYPSGYVIDDEMILDMLMGWTVVGAPPMRVKKAENLISFGQLHLVWPDTQALTAIKAELGEDVLLLNVRYQAETMQGDRNRSGHFLTGAAVSVVDPEYVGYGIGGFGHSVVTFDATTDRAGEAIPGFIEVVDPGKSFRVNWTPVFEDLARVHGAFSLGFAQALQKLAYPPQ